jgi:hypothetical protein
MVCTAGPCFFMVMMASITHVNRCKSSWPCDRGWIGPVLRFDPFDVLVVPRGSRQRPTHAVTPNVTGHNVKAQMTAILDASPVSARVPTSGSQRGISAPGQ